MHSTSPCSACGLPFRDDWVLLAESAGQGSPMATYLCPRCSMGRCGPRPSSSLATQYQSRLAVATLDGPESAHHTSFARNADASVTECIRDAAPGLVFDASIEWNRVEQAEARSQREAERMAQCLEQLSSIARHRKRTTAEFSTRPRIMQVGSGDGRFLAELQRRTRAKCVGVEPLMPSAPKKLAKHVEVVCATIEELEGSGPLFDLVFETAVLEHLANPRKHLRSIARRLKPDGRAIIEVGNLCGTTQMLEGEFLRPTRHNVFNAQALATMCSAAGLVPVQVIDDETLTIIARPAHPTERKQLPQGPSAKIIARCAWANNLRLTVKRGLTNSGPTQDMLSLAAHAHRNCNWAPGRADIALEIAVACEAEDKLEISAHWLRKSLEDRADDEVSGMLGQIEAILRARGQRRASTPIPSTKTPVFWQPRHSQGRADLLN